MSAPAYACAGYDLSFAAPAAGEILGEGACAGCARKWHVLLEALAQGDIEEPQNIPENTRLRT